MSERALPSGTVTFLMTDVEGSTRLLQEHGAGYADLLAEHRRILRGVFAAHSGVEVDTQGDALFVVFRSAADAVAAADRAQHELEGGQIRVRMGLHTGEPIVTEEGYVGLDVHRAARIAAAAHGGQVVLSETTRRLLDPATPIRDLGEHRLKDLTEAERIYQLGDADFAPIRTLDATNLPIASSALIGREAELEELVAELRSGARLLTLTGAGGTGKTRLALQVAAELVGTMRDGVFWVPLAGLSDHELVSAELAQTIGAREDLIGFLRRRELLVLLDNFEHLLAAAPAVSNILSAAAWLRILVTSRAPLRVSGEREYRLEPLPAREATELFVERARGIGRELVPDQTVDAICRRVDGLPLAVELAAARTKLLAPERLLDRLDAVLPILTGGARDLPERQRTLRATIEWSYDLLDEPDQELFRRLGVFAGGFAFEAAEAVCDADLDGLAALVDTSLLKPIGDNRFLMLQTIREYALERLQDSPNDLDAHRRHAAFCSAFAEQAYSGRFDEETTWSERLELDHDDLRAALDWTKANDESLALDLAGALGWFWLSHGHLVEGRRRLIEGLTASSGRNRSRARALTASGALAGRLGDPDEGRAQVEDAIGLWQELADEHELAAALVTLGWLLIYDAGDDAGALEAFERSLALHRKLGDGLGEARSLVGACQVLVALGETARAESLARELLERTDGDARTEHFAFHFLADCALIRGDFIEAETRYRESLRAALPLGDVIETSFEVQGIAMALAAQGELQRSLTLAGAVEALWESLGTWMSVAFWDALLERHIGAAREQLGPSADPAWAQGHALKFEDAVELALRARREE